MPRGEASGRLLPAGFKSAGIRAVRRVMSRKRQDRLQILQASLRCATDLGRGPRRECHSMVEIQKATFNGSKRIQRATRKRNILPRWNGQSETSTRRRGRGSVSTLSRSLRGNAQACPRGHQAVQRLRLVAPVVPGVSATRGTAGIPHGFSPIPFPSQPKGCEEACRIPATHSIFACSARFRDYR